MPAPTVPQMGGPPNSGFFRRGKDQINGGHGKGKFASEGGASRRRKIHYDCIRGITKPSIRRLARRGGVKRISAAIYDDIRTVMKERVHLILQYCVMYVEYRKAQTVTVHDVIFSLKHIGRPIYGFDPDTNIDPRKSKGRQH